MLKKEISELIDFDELVDETISINELAKHYKFELESYNMLLSGKFKRNSIESTGKFDDNTWVVLNDTSKVCSYIEFNKFDTLTFIGFSNSEKLLLKCFISKILLDNYYLYDDDESSTEGRATLMASSKLNILFDFIKFTNNFNSDMLHTSSGEKLRYYFISSYEKESPRYKAIYKIIEYLDFVLYDNNIAEDTYSKNIYIEYIDYLNILINDYTYKNDSKKQLPTSTNILLFNFYIKKFFEKDKISKSWKLYFYPIYIWWKLTNIIPMRANEVCVKISRDCLMKEDENYFIIINRSKLRSLNWSQEVKLPVLKKYQINKEFYDLINYYIEDTNEYGESKSLFSYHAYDYYKKLLSSDDELFKHLNKNIKEAKYDTNYFTTTQLNILLYNFYTKIIQNYYNDTLINEKVKLNDTRHFAFTSLLLQGIPLVEIAILGGHADMSTLSSYTYNSNVYIDSQVFVNINKNLSNNKLNTNTIYEIVFNQPKECPVQIEDCVETEFDGINLGYCTSNTASDCENYSCYYCSKWYCEPIKSNFSTLCDIVSKELNKQNDILQNDIDFLLKLFKNSALLHSKNPEEDISIEKSMYNKMQQASRRIQANSDEIIDLKSRLFQSCFDCHREYSELDIIKNLSYLKKHFNDNSKYLK